MKFLELGRSLIKELLGVSSKEMNCPVCPPQIVCEETYKYLFFGLLIFIGLFVSIKFVLKLYKKLYKYQGEKK